MKHLTLFKNIADALACSGLLTPQVASIVGNGSIQASKEKYGDEITIKLIDGKLVPIPSYLGLKFTSTGNSTISLTNNGGNTPDIKYSLDNGETWTQWDYSSISLSNGQSVIMKGNNPNGFSISSSKYSKFIMTGSLAASGNIMSLIDNGLCQTLIIPNSYCYYLMFYNCSSLTSVPKLPATTLANSCYERMFSNCSSLTSAPELPATTLEYACYASMFLACTSLTSAPELPATTLASQCYSSMFWGCSSLTSAPALPATTLAGSCYYYMFQNCSSLTSAPALPATTLAGSCYSNMFNGCSSLTSAPALPATTLAGGCYSNMFRGCSSLTSAPVLPATTLTDGCYYSMFINCSSLTSAPALPATTLVEGCYSNMFWGCSSLTSAPELPATTLAIDCYSNMFCVCSNITSISLNNNLTSISAYSMSNMLEGTIIIPNSVTSIDSHAFYSYDYDDYSSITALVVNGVTYERNEAESMTVTLANGTSVTLEFFTKW